MLLNNSSTMLKDAAQLLNSEEAETPLVKEARRIMEVCNSCRYCGGFCAVFPAMELRRSFSRGDLEYLSNLCHNCTSCFHACQYAPPQEFDINNPKIMAELRAETYEKYAWPAPLAKLFHRNGTVMSLIVAFSVMAVLILTFMLQSKNVIFSAYQGANSFYQIIPYNVMIGVPIVIMAFSVFALFMGVIRFARGTGWKMSEMMNPALMTRAIIDVLLLRYLGGAGDGCNYEDDTFSHKRRYFHQTLFFGFMLCVASTTAAAIYDHIFHWPAPYPLTSFPVVSGTLGGVGLLIGTSGLFWTKMKRDKRPLSESLLGMDISFMLVLFLTSLSGLLLLFMRENTMMGSLLILHLGLVAGLFITLPYSKFVHAIYRFAALVRYAGEKRSNPRGDGIV
ncbi:tricarballylate utilization 4Fe-4S protein TcuB [uncultured Desulfuromusa sp.]|uniref:tricarballylate utilization 4Fe-4S protein TcuB n=1 Tax=uncultured Desulfuromusa sp. TaxID=219183 RepID=UPI002AA95BCB|nr:tricarballylate utilization 4Fe-4S protein TcuB [uncultured Desulfuromusa sp.]